MQSHHAKCQPQKDANSRKILSKCSSKEFLQTRISTAGCESRAAVKRRLWLRGGTAIQATLLAPSQKTSSFAMFEGVLTIGSVAHTASTGDTELTDEAIVEFVLIELQTGGSKATLAAGLTNGGGICEFGLIVSRATTCQLKAWRGFASWDSGARRKISLGRGSAIEAALLAPSKEASTLAILESEVGSNSIALGARGADANGTGQACIEFVVINALCQRERSLATFVGSVTEVIVIHALDGGLIVG